MNIKELDNLIEGIISKEIKNFILNESEEQSFEVYHIKCDGEPVETFATADEAEEHLDKFKKEYPGKQFIIEKEAYSSYADMIEKMDLHGEQLEEKENKPMENTTPKFTSLAEAIAHAKEQGHKKIKVGNEVYNVDECWKELEEQEWAPMEETHPQEQDEQTEHYWMGEEDEPCAECGDKEQEDEGNAFSGALAQAKAHGEKEFKVDGHEYDVEEGHMGHDDDYAPDPDSAYEDKTHTDDEEHILDLNDLGDEDDEEGEEGEEDPDDILYRREQNGYYNQDRGGSRTFPQDREGGRDWQGRMEEEDMNEMLETPMCNECGMGYINEETGCCNECGAPYQMEEHKEDGDACPVCGKHKEMCECGGMGMYESKKKTIRLTETELVNLVAKMVQEAGIPGLQAYEKSHKANGTQNKKEVADMMKDVTKNHINIDGSDKPEFPHANGKGDKVAFNNTSEEDQVVDDNRGRNPFDLTYDIEPSKQFKDRLKKAIEGHSTMGNAPTTEAPSIEPSNGADKGEAAETAEGNQMKTDTGKKIEKESKRRKEIKKKEPLYAKQPAPVTTVNEGRTFQASVLLEEQLKKMKNLASYNKKTQ